MESVVNSFWKDRNAFVTGATGFVGAHVARALVERGARVVCLQRDSVRAGSLDLLGLQAASQSSTARSKITA